MGDQCQDPICYSTEQQSFVFNDRGKNQADRGISYRSDSTTTLDTTALNYPYEYGRRYHAYMAEKRNISH
jgi:hypothetical protein